MVTCVIFVLSEKLSWVKNLQLLSIVTDVTVELAVPAKYRYAFVLLPKYFKPSFWVYSKLVQPLKAFLPISLMLSGN